MTELLEGAFGVSLFQSLCRRWRTPTGFFWGFPFSESLPEMANADRFLLGFPFFRVFAGDGERRQVSFGVSLFQSLCRRWRTPTGFFWGFPFSESLPEMANADRFLLGFPFFRVFAGDGERRQVSFGVSLFQSLCRRWRTPTGFFWGFPFSESLPEMANADRFLLGFPFFRVFAGDGERRQVSFGVSLFQSLCRRWRTPTGFFWGFPFSESLPEMANADRFLLGFPFFRVFAGDGERRQVSFGVSLFQSLCRRWRTPTGFFWGFPFSESLPEMANADRFLLGFPFFRVFAGDGERRQVSFGVSLFQSLCRRWRTPTGFFWGFPFSESLPEMANADRFLLGFPFFRVFAGDGERRQVSFGVSLFQSLCRRWRTPTGFFWGFPFSESLPEMANADRFLLGFPFFRVFAGDGERRQVSFGVSLFQSLCRRWRTPTGFFWGFPFSESLPEMANADRFLLGFPFFRVFAGDGERRQVSFGVSLFQSLCRRWRTPTGFFWGFPFSESLPEMANADRFLLGFPFFRVFAGDGERRQVSFGVSLFQSLCRRWRTPTGFFWGFPFSESLPEMANADRFLLGFPFFRVFAGDGERRQVSFGVSLFQSLCRRWRTPTGFFWGFPFSESLPEMANADRFLLGFPFFRVFAGDGERRQVSFGVSLFQSLCRRWRTPTGFFWGFPFSESLPEMANADRFLLGFPFFRVFAGDGERRQVSFGVSLFQSLCRRWRTPTGFFWGFPFSESLPEMANADRFLLGFPFFRVFAGDGERRQVSFGVSLFQSLCRRWRTPTGFFWGFPFSESLPEMANADRFLLGFPFFRVFAGDGERRQVSFGVSLFQSLCRRWRTPTGFFWGFPFSESLPEMANADRFLLGFPFFRVFAGDGERRQVSFGVSLFQSLCRRWRTPTGFFWGFPFSESLPEMANADRFLLGFPFFRVFAGDGERRQVSFGVSLFQSLCRRWRTPTGFFWGFPFSESLPEMANADRFLLGFPFFRVFAGDGERRQVSFGVSLFQSLCRRWRTPTGFFWGFPFSESLPEMANADRFLLGFPFFRVFAGDGERRQVSFGVSLFQSLCRRWRTPTGFFWGFPFSESLPEMANADRFLLGFPFFRVFAGDGERRQVSFGVSLFQSLCRRWRTPTGFFWGFPFSESLPEMANADRFLLGFPFFRVFAGDGERRQVSFGVSLFQSLCRRWRTPTGFFWGFPFSESLPEMANADRFLLGFPFFRVFAGDGERRQVSFGVSLFQSLCRRWRTPTGFFWGFPFSESLPEMANADRFLLGFPFFRVFAGDGERRQVSFGVSLFQSLCRRWRTPTGFFWGFPFSESLPEMANADRFLEFLA